MPDSFPLFFSGIVCDCSGYLGGRREAARKFFGSPLFQPLDDILHPLPVIFKADFSISVIERADFSHDPLKSIYFLLAWGSGTIFGMGVFLDFI